MNKKFTVGQLATATGTKPVTIRYYEKVGVLPSASRDESGYRRYSVAERDRLLFIRRSRALGFSLDDIRELLELADQTEDSCAAVDAKVQVQLSEIRRRIEDLRAMENELKRLSACCNGGVIEECRIIESLSGRSTTVK
ncbi:MerR family transcriptional regulator [Pseudidiomarina salinarum]|uniref:MerR family transcriptional regulator n=1 Tax=Pseudidiomarina salinarum TaxID=435908 RepID=A0A094JE61_9GAMM|nr:helix-turn-helix domain-containing protein [Pseudidiomarina salinarum]KFZ30826.1 MerR family transcriptional regulator [Pseudidiomarina salinarum]RUO71295.1 MerR family transcriptional regulator [Pseudidiomarina salinarum]